MFSVDVTRCCFWSAVRILGTNLAVKRCIPNSLSEHTGMSHSQFPPPQQCREWSDIDPDGWVLELMQQFQELCSLWVSLYVRHQLMCNRSWTGHATETPAYDSRFGPQRLAESLWGSFTKIGTKFDSHSLFLSLIHHKNRHRSHTQLQINMCENCPCPPSYVQLGTLTH
jgi:hypothetical protein